MKLESSWIRGAAATAVVGAFLNGCAFLPDLTCSTKMEIADIPRMSDIGPRRDMVLIEGTVVEVNGVVKTNPFQGKYVAIVEKNGARIPVIADGLIPSPGDNITSCGTPVFQTDLDGQPTQPTQLVFVQRGFPTTTKAQS